MQYLIFKIHLIHFLHNLGINLLEGGSASDLRRRSVIREVKAQLWILPSSAFVGLDNYRVHVVLIIYDTIIKTLRWKADFSIHVLKRDENTHRETISGMSGTYLSQWLFYFGLQRILKDPLPDFFYKEKKPIGNPRPMGYLIRLGFMCSQIKFILQFQHQGGWIKPEKLKGYMKWNTSN